MPHHILRGTRAWVTSMKLTETKTALAHHWFLNVSGGERVCAAMYEVLPNPDVCCIVARDQGLPDSMKAASVRTSFIQHLPWAVTHHRYYAPLFPLAVEHIDFRSYDLVVSSDSAGMKGIITRPDTCHICYCHSPMRYAWNMAHDYLHGRGPLMTIGISAVMHYLRLWDYSASARVDFFVANSNTVRARIRKYYRREAQVIYPPCDVESFDVSGDSDDYYLFVGRLVDYKRADLAVNAFGSNGRRLLVVGDGPLEGKLKSMASGNIEFLGWVKQEELRSLYSRCRAVVFPGEEDFGLVPVEAQACGKPVLAFARGGATETVIPGKTGLWFYEQTPESLNRIVMEFEKTVDSFDPHVIGKHAGQFGTARFKQEFVNFVESCLQTHGCETV